MWYDAIVETYAGPKSASPTPVARLLKIININIDELKPVHIVAILQRRILNTRMFLLLILSPNSPEIGTSVAKAKLNVVAINPICASESKRSALIDVSRTLKICLSA